MTDGEFALFLRRVVRLAEWLLLCVVRIGWSVISFLFWGLIILSLPFARLFILLPLTFAMMGGAGAAIFFAWHGEWADVTSAVVVATIAALLFGGYSHCAEKIDPSFGKMPPSPRWRDDEWYP